MTEIEKTFEVQSVEPEKVEKESVYILKARKGNYYRPYPPFYTYESMKRVYDARVADGWEVEIYMY